MIPFKIRMCPLRNLMIGVFSEQADVENDGAVP